MRAGYPVPRWQTPLPSTVVGSWGPDVEAWARRELGITLDRWQRRALNRALAYDLGFHLVHRIYLISTARQNGKTALVRALIGWALTARVIPAWSAIAGLAHDRTQARIPYQAVAQDLAPMARRLGPTSRGGLNITRYLGIRSETYGRHREYHTYSREARNAIRGTSNDLVLFDEVRTQIDDETWAAVEPTTTARPDPLIVGISTAGSERSVLLRAWFDRGLRIIEGAEPANGFGMTWYAPPDSADPTDPRTWPLANPSIADRRMDPQRIRDAWSGLTPAAFRAERLNLWSDAQDAWLPPGVWAMTTSDQPELPGRPLIAVEVTPSWRRVTVTVAWLTDAGAWVGIADELDASRTAAATVDPREIAAMLDRVRAAWSPSAIAYSAAAAAAPTVAAWAERTRTRPIALGAREIRAACELFRGELVGGRLGHADDPVLGAQMRVARPNVPIESGGWFFSVRESSGEIDALRAAAWASWAAIAPPERVVAPQIFLGNGPRAQKTGQAGPSPTDLTD